MLEQKTQKRMSQLLPQTGSQQLNAGINIFTNLLVELSIMVASIYCENIQRLRPGRQEVDGLTLNIVDLRGNCTTIHKTLLL